jgi:hypothetical protein
MSTEIAKDYQTFLYGLFNKNINSLGGSSDINKETGMMDTYIAKSELLDALITVLNEFGETMAKDERFKNDTNS